MAERTAGKPTMGRAAAIRTLAGLGLLAAGIKPARAQVYGPDQAAAARGTDAYGLDGANWEVGYVGDSRREWLKPDPSGNHHLVKLDPSTIAEGYLDLLQRPGDNVTFLQGPVRPITLVVNGAGLPPLYPTPEGLVSGVYIRGGTLWTGPNVSAERLYNQVKPKEIAEQRGVVVAKVGFNSDCPFPLPPVPKPTDNKFAAFWFGGDDYSAYEPNWTVSESDGVVTASLPTRGDGHHTRLRWQEGLRGLLGTNIELWWEALGPDGTPLALPGFGDGTQLWEWGIETRGAAVRAHFEPGYPADRRSVVPEEYQSFSNIEFNSQGKRPLPIGFNPFRPDLICAVDP